MTKTNEILTMENELYGYCHPGSTESSDTFFRK